MPALKRNSAHRGKFVGGCIARVHAMVTRGSGIKGTPADGAGRLMKALRTDRHAP